MKVDLSSLAASAQISKKTTEPTTTAPEAKLTQTSAASTQDRTSLSTGQNAVGSLVNQAMTTPELRQDKVNSARQSIENGSFKFDAEKVADAIIASNKDA